MLHQKKHCRATIQTTPKLLSPYAVPLISCLEQHMPNKAVKEERETTAVQEHHLVMCLATGHLGYAIETTSDNSRGTPVSSPGLLRWRRGQSVHISPRKAMTVCPLIKEKKTAQKKGGICPNHWDLEPA